MKPTRIIETALYAPDLEQIEVFYGKVLALKPFLKVPGRHVFFRLERQMLLFFNPEATRHADSAADLPVPPHGAIGPGHLCFAASAEEIEAWHRRLLRLGVVIESDFRWPSGHRSIYFRDPAGNSIEFTEPGLWDLA